MITTIILAIIFDLLIGDPKYHPIVLIGRFIAFLERRLWSGLAGGVGQFIRGGVLSVVVIVVTGGAAWGLQAFFSRFGEQIFVRDLRVSDILIGFAASFAISIRGLEEHVMEVVRRLGEGGDLTDARAALSKIVGRETSRLDREGILRATLETLFENVSDGIIAPLFYLAIGGLPLAFGYKAVNTLDSMIGYRSERYIYFGRAAARIDDAANYIPARLTGILVVIGAIFIRIFDKGLSPYNGLRIMLRDGRKHKSPNSGIPEAACAGLYNIRLGGPSFYGGVLVEKPFIGEDLNRPSEKMVLSGVRVVKIGVFFEIIFLIKFF